MSMDCLLKLREVAQLLRLSPQTVYKMLKQGTIPAIKVGSQWRFNQEQIEGWLMGGQSRPNGETAPASAQNR